MAVTKTHPINSTLKAAIDYREKAGRVNANEPIGLCLFERHVVHIRTSDNISYYISSARRTQGRKCE